MVTAHAGHLQLVTGRKYHGEGKQRVSLINLIDVLTMSEFL